MTEETTAQAVETAPAVSEFKTRPVPSAFPEAPSAQPEPAAPTPEEKGETPEAQAAPDEPDDDEAGSAPEKQPLPKGVQRKINKLTRRYGEAQAEIQELKERLSGLDTVQQKPVEQAAKDDGKPKLADFDFDPEKHAEALVDWKLQQKAKTEAITERQRKFAEQESAFAAEHPDYAEVSRNPDVPITRDMVLAMMETDNPPALAYYLGQHPDEAAQIAQMTPLSVARAIGRIEAQLATKPKPAAEPLPKKTTNAPPPPKTVTGAGKSEKSVDDPDLSTAQRIALWRAGKK